MIVYKMTFNMIVFKTTIEEMTMDGMMVYRMTVDGMTVYRMTVEGMTAFEMIACH